MPVAPNEAIVLPSAARSAAPATVEVYTAGYRAIEACLDLTAFVTAASLTLNLQVNDPVAGWKTVLSSAVIAAVSTTFIRFGLDAPEVVNASRFGPLTGSVRITVTHGNGNSHTYSIGARLT